MPLAEQIGYVQEHLPGAIVQRMADGVYQIRWRVTLSEPWSPSEATLVLMIPPLFPAQAPSGFDTVEPITRGGSGAGGTGMRQVESEQLQHWCWNPKDTLDYSRDDAIWRFAKFAESRFLRHE